MSASTTLAVGRGFMSGSAITQTVYGQVPDSPANVDLAPGLYTDTITVTVSAVGVAFGTYTPLQVTPLDMNGTINIACTGVTGRNSLTIDLSTGASNNYLTRTLTTGTYTLSYNLYSAPPTPRSGATAAAAASKVPPPSVAARPMPRRQCTGLSLRARIRRRAATPTPSW